MTTINTVALHYDVGGDVAFRDGRWTAYAEPSGITVHAPTKQEATDRATELVRFFVSTIQSRRGVATARRYLDSHGVASTVVENEMSTPIRYRHAVTSSTEVALGV